MMTEERKPVFTGQEMAELVTITEAETAIRVFMEQSDVLLQCESTDHDAVYAARDAITALYEANNRSADSIFAKAGEDGI
jgi:hypothetical protein